MVARHLGVEQAAAGLVCPARDELVGDARRVA
jgi:hypothetical protein